MRLISQSVLSLSGRPSSNRDNCGNHYLIIYLHIDQGWGKVLEQNGGCPKWLPYQKSISMTILMGGTPQTSICREVSRDAYIPLWAT